MRLVLESVGSSAVGLIDKILQNGYLKPPADYEYHGYYRITLTDSEKEQMLKELERAKDELATQIEGLPKEELQEELHYRRQYVDFWERTMTEEPIPWEVAKASQKYIDLRKADLRQFEAFIFDHQAPESEQDKEWYFDRNLWIEYDEQRNVELFMELFKESEALHERYSRDQLEQGCWAMMGGGMVGNVHQLIWDSELDTGKKERLIESVFDLYANLFSSDPLDTACDMWWDSLAYDFNPMNLADPEGNDEHRRVRDAMFHTLTQILQLESPACQRAALHGLNHVLHPETETVVNEYLARHPALTKEDREYALACSRGDAI